MKTYGISIMILASLGVEQKNFADEKRCKEHKRKGYSPCYFQNRTSLLFTDFTVNKTIIYVLLFFTRIQIVVLLQIILCSAKANGSYRGL